MSGPNEPVIRVTLEEIQAAATAQQTAAPVTTTSPAGTTGKTYGNINAAQEIVPVSQQEKGSFLLQGWFYLGAAGLVGATAGWGICEPAFIDSHAAHSWGNTWMVPLVLLMMLIGFATAESLVERSVKKALKRLAIVIPLGVVLGFIFDGTANVVFGITTSVVAEMGVRTIRNPAFWIARGIGWAIFGIAGGLVYGIVGNSAKKGKYGVLGGMIGAGLGGMLFDPISLAMHDNAVLSRAVGFALFGMATGAAMGFVESALKDRWLYVSSGPLAGKQFILYKSLTTIGSSQECDIYLFKDSSIAPQQASIELRGAQAMFRSATPVFVSGVPAQARVLLSGDTIQIGRYAFRYNERHRS